MRENRAPAGARRSAATPSGVLIGFQVHGAEVARRERRPDPNPFAAPGAAARGRRAGDRRARPDAARLRRRLPAGRARRRPAAWRCCTAAGAGWPRGIVERGAEEVGASAAAIGPGIGPCCYEVGDEVLAAFAELGEGSPTGRMLDLPEVARRLLAARRGRARSRPAGLCTSCDPELFFSHRRDGGRTGRQAGLGRGSSEPEPDPRHRPARSSAQPRAGARAAAGRGSRCWRRPSTSPLEEMGALAEAGVELVGENRLQDLEAKQRALAATRSTWDFIGNLQSRKVKRILPLVRLIHSVATDSVLEQLGRHASPEHRGAGRGQRRRRGGQGRGRARRARRVHRALPGARRRPDDDAAVHRRPGGLAALLRRASPSSPPSTGSSGSRWAPARTGGSRSRRARRSSGWAPRCTADEAVPGASLLHNPGKGIADYERETRSLWHFETHGTARSSTSASPRTPSTHEHDLYEPDTAPHGQVYEARLRPRRRPSAASSERRRGARRDRRHLRRRRAARGATRSCARSAATAAPTSRSTWSPRATSTTPRRSPTGSSAACR